MHLYCMISLVTSSIHVTQALHAGKFCPAACDLTLNYATFNDTDPWLSRKARSCRSELRVTSLYLCFDENCVDDGEKEKWIEVKSLWCDENAGVTLPVLSEVLERWNEDRRTTVRRLSADEILQWPTLKEVVLPSHEFYQRAFTTMDTSIRQYELHLTYGWCMYYFWIIVISIGIGSRLLNRIRKLISENRTYTKLPSDTTSTLVHQNARYTKVHAWLKQHLIIPATFGSRCSQPYFHCTIPPRIQCLTIFTFILLNITLCSISYELTTGNLYWPQKSTQLLRFISDRTGILSLANFPLIWLFGMRNDVLIWLTGWGFGTYNAFHRWVARVATVQAVVHSLGYTVMILESGGWNNFLRYWTKYYFWNGEIATVVMCGLLGFSFYGIRRAHYEFFLVMHIVLSVATLWSMYYHVAIFTAGDWNIFIWPCVVVWVFDRLLRVGRILAFNPRFWNTKATVSYDAGSNIVRMEVDASKSWIKPQPGVYYYIHVLNDMRYMHQSHPFTLAYTSSDTTPQQNLPLSPLLSTTSRPPTHRTTSSSSTSSTESDALLPQHSFSSKHHPTTPNNNLTFLIRPYNGFTSRLRNSCSASTIHTRVLIDGPYGSSLPLHAYPHILFITGGTGIAVALSHLSSLLSLSTSHSSSQSNVQSVKIIWAVRQHAFLTTILSSFRGLLADERVQMEVHITADSQVHAEVLGEDLRNVRIVTRRPDISAVVRDIVQSIGYGARVAVVACGPARMADEARQACVGMVGRGFAGLEYFEESFKW